MSADAFRAGTASSQPTIFPLSRVADGCAVLTVAIGLSTIAGWVLGIEPLKRILPTFVAMKFNTALCFVFAGAALGWRNRPLLRFGFGAPVVLLAAMTLGEYLTGRDLGIDQLFFRDLLSRPEEVFPPGRMSPSTALCFLFCGPALCGGFSIRNHLHGSSSRRVGLAKGIGYTAEVLMLGVIAISGFSIVGYATGAAYLYHLPGFVAMALHTGAAFVILGVGILCAKEGTIARSMRLRGTGGVLGLGFGVLIILPAAVGIVNAMRLQTLADDIDVQANNARPRREATYGLESNVLGFAVQVRAAADGDDSARHKALSEAVHADQYLAEYLRLAENDRQRKMAQKFADLWRDFLASGRKILKAGAQSGREEWARFGAVRLDLDLLVTEEMRPDAVSVFEARKVITLEDLRTTGDLPLALLVVSMVIALMTSRAVARAVLNREQRLCKQAADLQLQHEELMRADKCKSEFLANVSHELRTPLNSVLILAGLLAEDKKGTLTAEQSKYASTIYSSGNDLLSLINDILDLSRIEAGRVDIQGEPVDLTELVETLKNTFQPVAAQKGLGFDTRLETDAPASIFIDSVKLQQILRNLISNGIKFTDAGNVLLIIAGSADDRVRFSVVDNGPGIPPDQHELIFEAFRQADGTAQRKHGGTGLGLTISRKLARLLGGDLSVESAVGRGSTFTLLVPCEPPLQPPCATPADAEPLPPEQEHILQDVRTGETAPAGKTILVVEDNAHDIFTLSSVLESRGAKLCIARNGREALNVLDRVGHESAAGVDLVLMDIMMPEMDGLTAMREIRKHAEWKNLPIIALTAKAMIDDREKCLKAGADDYIAKPFDIKKLVSCIIAACAKREEALLEIGKEPHEYKTEDSARR